MASSSPLITPPSTQLVVEDPATKKPIDPITLATLLKGGFFAVPLSGGYTWSPASRLGQLLHEAELKFGPRDPQWTILGVEYAISVIPHTWFPGNRKQVLVQLTSSAFLNAKETYYQLAHEVVHLLDPAPGESANVMEEGLATMFSEDCTSQEFNVTQRAKLASYSEAATLARELLAVDADAILKLRSITPQFRRMSADTFVRAGVMAPLGLIERLLAPFVRT